MRQFLIKKNITAEQLRSKRKQLKLTQQEFAALAGVSKPTIERWETSDKPISGPIVPLLELLTQSYLEQKLILKDLGLPFYDPFLIIQRTEGRMAEDNFWIKIEK